MVRFLTLITACFFTFDFFKSGQISLVYLHMELLPTNLKNEFQLPFAVLLHIDLVVTKDVMTTLKSERLKDLCVQ